MPRVNILGVEMEAASREEILTLLGGWFRSSTPRQIITVNSLMLLDAKKDSGLRELLWRAALLIPDSSGILWAAKFLNRPLPDIYPGVELMLDLCQLCAREKRRICLLGGQESVASQAGRRLQSLCPGLEIMGGWNGYFSEKEEENIIREIRLKKPAVLFVGLGSPRQEFWIDRHLEKLNVPVTMGVGGSLDIYAGRLQRAPEWIRKLGGEWSYRLIQEPSRLPRILRLPRFALAIMAQKLAILIHGR